LVSLGPYGRLDRSLRGIFVPCEVYTLGRSRKYPAAACVSATRPVLFAIKQRIFYGMRLKSFIHVFRFVARKDAQRGGLQQA
jgi:hypothetical protein